MMDTSPTGHFAYWTVRLLFGHFAYWTLRLLVISPVILRFSVPNSPALYTVSYVISNIANNKNNIISLIYRTVLLMT